MNDSINTAAELGYWITERYKIKVLKDAGHPAPWSRDPNMAHVRYCNVHREDDKVTRWLAKHWRPQFPVYWATVLARMINRIETLEAILPLVQKGDSLGDIGAFLKGRRDAGHTIFTGVYTISTCGKAMDKIDYVLWVVQQTVFLGDYTGPNTLEGAWQWLQKVDGLGSFLAAQVVADLKNTEGHYLQRATDFWSWAAPGPGSLRGLNWFFNRRATGTIKERNFMPNLIACYNETKPHIGEDVPPIHMQDFQNCMCEFSKYMKVKYDGARPRNKYRPGQD